MKQTINNQMKVDNKALNAVAKGVAKELQAQKRDAKNERKNLTQTINFLCAAETESGANFRNFFDLAKNANKAARKDAARYISSKFTYALRVVKYECTANCEADEVEETFVKFVPCTKNGKEITDFLDVVCNIVKSELVNRPKLQEIGRQIKTLWESEGSKKETDKVRYAMAIKNTFAKKIESYRVKTAILGTIVKR